MAIHSVFLYSRELFTANILKKYVVILDCYGINVPRIQVNAKISFSSLQDVER